MGIAHEGKADAFPARRGRRTSRAVALALISLVLTALAVRGPAQVERRLVSWPAPGAPSVVVANATIWATPLLLSAHSPQSLRVEIPCATVSNAGRGSIELFATTSDPSVADRLAVIARDDVLEVYLGEMLLASTMHAGSVPSCVLGLAFEADGFGSATWHLRETDDVVASGVSAPPVVSGLSSDVDPVTSGVRVELVTRAASSHPSIRQWLATALAALAAVAAFLALPSAGRTTRTRPSVTRMERRADAVVVAASVMWWLLGPWYFDDGWLMATVRARDGSGSFSNYFDTLGAQMPLGFAHHVLLWPFAATDAPFLLWRTVPLVASLLTWILVRRIHARSFPVRGSSIAALAAAHLVVVFAWLLTLRPEPVIALLSAVVCNAALTHRARGDARSLCLASVCVAAAITMHPSGIVAAAPLVIVVAPLWRRARHDRCAFVDTMVAFAVASTVGGLLLFADTDVARWRVDRGLFAGDGFHSRGVFDEPDRYRDLLSNGTLPQLASVIVAAVALVSWLCTRIRKRADLSPPVFGAMTVAGCALLTLTPSKWTYHFGSLAALATLLIGAEAARSIARGRIVAVVVPVLLVFAAARSFRDDRDAQYFLQLGTRHLGALGSSWLWLAALVTAAVFGPSRRLLARWSFAAALGVVAVVSLVSFAILSTAEGPRWATGRAGINDLVHGGCPLAGALDVTDLATGSALTRRDAPGDGVYLLDEATDTDLVVTLRAPQGSGGGVLLVSWVRDDTGARRVIEERSVRAPSFDASVYGPAPEFRHVRISHASDRPRDADAVVLTVRDDVSPIAPLAIVGVTAARSISLASLLEGRRALVSPPQLPLLRCTTPPILHAGVVEAPDIVIGFEYRGGIVEIPELGSRTSPWYLARDAYATTTAWGWLTDSDAFAVTMLRARVVNNVPFLSESLAP